MRQHWLPVWYCAGAVDFCRLCHPHVATATCAPHSNTCMRPLPAGKRGRNAQFLADAATTTWLLLPVLPHMNTCGSSQPASVAAMPVFWPLHCAHACRCRRCGRHSTLPCAKTRPILQGVTAHVAAPARMRVHVAHEDCPQSLCKHLGRIPFFSFYQPQ